MIEKDMLPNLPVLEGEVFRREHVYNSLVNLVLARNQVVLRRLYEGTGTESPASGKAEPAHAAADKKGKEAYPTKLPLDDLGLKVDENSAQAAMSVGIHSIRALCQRANLNIDEARVNMCYVESLQSRVDTLKDPSLPNQMKYVEFLLFICRLSHELYVGTKEEDELQLYEKIENVLDPLLSTVSVKKVFSYTAKLEEAKARAKEEAEDEAE